MAQDWQESLQNLQGVTIESAGGVWPIQVRGTVDGVPFHFRHEYGASRLEIGEREPWIYASSSPSPEEVASMLAKAFESWRAEREPESDVAKARRCLSAYIDQQRERLRRVDDASLAAVIGHMANLVRDPQFDSVAFLSYWLFVPVSVPSLGWIAPVDVLRRADGLALVKEALGRWVYGVAM